MVFSKRERLIIALTALVLCVLVLDRYAMIPLLNRRSAVEVRKARLIGEMERAGSLLRRRRQIGERWRRMLAGGMKGEAGEAESQILHAVRDWSAEAGLDLSSLRPERSSEESSLPEIEFHAAGVGTMAAISRFLWRMETAGMPVKLKMLRVGSRKEGMDDLSLQLRISTVYLPSSRAGEETDVGAASDGGDQ